MSKQTPQLKNGQKTQLDIFPKEDILMANRHMERCPTSFVIREIQLKATMRYGITSVRMSTIRNTNNNYWQGWGEKRIIMTVGGNVSWHSPQGEHIVMAQRIKTITTKQSGNSHPGLLFEENKNINWKRYMHPYVNCSIFYNSQDMEAT